MVRRALLVLLMVLGCLAPVSLLTRNDVGGTAFASERKECIVYVTRTGTKYHQGGCRYLRSSKIPMTKSKAVKAGYTPCKRCGGGDC